MLKRFLCAVTAFLILLTLVSCEDGEGKDAEYTADTVTEYYARRGISCWQDAAAVYLTGGCFSDIDIAYPDCSSGAKSEAECLLMHALSGASCDKEHTSVCRAVVEEGYSECTVETLALCAFALEVTGAEYDCTAAAKYLCGIQLSGGGYPIANEYSLPDETATAYALELTLLWRDEMTDNSYDSVLVYTADSFTSHNLISDGDNESAVVSAMVLRGLIHAGISPDGNISNAMKEAFRVVFEVSINGKLLGFKQYESDTTYSAEATSEVMYALAVTMYGDIFSKISGR